LLDAFGHLAKRAAQLVQPLPGLRARGDDGCARDELLRLLDHELHEFGVDGICLRHGDDAVLDPEQADDGEVLVGLWPRAFAGIHREQKEVDAGGARHHVRNEAFVARHVDEREPAAVCQLERRVAEVDRDPARPFLRQAVRVFPRQGPDEPRLPVVDVAGGAYRERHALTAAATSSTSSSEIVRQSRRSRPSRTMPTTGGSAARSGAASFSSRAQA
jgi:hypothetical protein